MHLSLWIQSLKGIEKGLIFPHKLSRAPGCVKWVFLGKTVSWTEEAREGGRECLWVSLSPLGGRGMKRLQGRATDPQCPKCGSASLLRESSLPPKLGQGRGWWGI